MSHRWPAVRLGEVVRHRKEFVTIDDLHTYRRPRVQLHAQGIVLRDEVPGALIKTKQQQVCRAGELLVAEIDAKVGGFGLVPTTLDGCVVSSHYFLFELDEAMLDRSFLGYFIRTPRFRGQVEAQGSTNYAAIRPADVLRYEIPLPPLSEQRRLVTRIEDLAARIGEARGLRRKAVEEARVLFLSRVGQVFNCLSSRHPVRPFGLFSPHVSSGPRNWATHYEDSGQRFYRAQDVGPDGEILGDSKVFVSQPPGEQGRSATLERGDLLLVITGATVGRVAVYRDGLEPGLVSQHVAVCRLPAERLDPEFALWGLRGPAGQAQLLGQRYGQGKPGLNLSNIRALSLPCPPVPEQQVVVVELAALQAEVGKLKELQGDTAAELDALLPSILDRAFNGEL